MRWSKSRTTLQPRGRPGLPFAIAVQWGVKPATATVRSSITTRRSVGALRQIHLQHTERWVNALDRSLGRSYLSTDFETSNASSSKPSSRKRSALMTPAANSTAAAELQVADMVG